LDEAASEGDHIGGEEAVAPHVRNDGLAKNIALQKTIFGHPALRYQIIQGKTKSARLYLHLPKSVDLTPRDKNITFLTESQRRNVVGNEV